MLIRILGESDLDLEYAMTLANPIPVTLYQVGDEYIGGRSPCPVINPARPRLTTHSASFNTFLDALDASYCTYQGGDGKTKSSNFGGNH